MREFKRLPTRLPHTDLIAIFDGLCHVASTVDGAYTPLQRLWHRLPQEDAEPVLQVGLHLQALRDHRGLQSLRGDDLWVLVIYKSDERRDPDLHIQASTRAFLPCSLRNCFRVTCFPGGAETHADSKCLDALMNSVASHAGFIGRRQALLRARHTVPVPQPIVHSGHKALWFSLNSNRDSGCLP